MSLQHMQSRMASLLFDLRHTVRALLKSPVFTCVTLVTLALGIGANAAVFSLVNAALLRPLGYANVDRLVLLYQASTSANVDKMAVSLPDLLDLRAMQHSFEATAAYRNRTFEVSDAGEPERIHAARMESSVIPTLGVEPMLGRNFTTEEDTPGHDVAILSYGFWQRRYRGDPGVLGSRLLLDRRQHAIVGVMGPAFQFPRGGPRFNNQPAAVYVPMGFTDLQRAERGRMFNNGVVARLRPGVTLEQARSELDVLGRRIRARYGAQFPSSLTIQVHAFPIRDEVSGPVRRPLLILLAAVGLVLLVACANVANLILSRAASRRREISLRAALGAGRPRLLQMLLIENLVLALVGGALGLLLATWGVQSVPRAIAIGLPGVENVAIDARVLVFTAVVSLLTALLFGLAPLSFAGRLDLASALRAGASAGSGGSYRSQRSLVVATITLAVMLLCAAGLVLRSFGRLMATRTGFNPDRVLTLTVTLPREAYSTAEQVRGFYAVLSERAVGVAGVLHAGGGSDLPMRGDEGERRGFTPDRSALPPTTTALTWVTRDYFQALGIELVSGRYFLPEEVTERRDTVIVNESLAKQAWPGHNPIGQRLRWGIRSEDGPWLTVVGVVGDVNNGPPGVPAAIHAYEPYSQVLRRTLESDLIDLGRTIHLVVRGGDDPTQLLEPLRAELARLDRSLAISRVSTMRQQVSDAVAPQRFSTILLTVFAGGALLLAAIGLYGVLTLSVAGRTREIGVRLALGASRSNVLTLVVRQGMTLAAIGLALGIAGALAVTPLMTSILYQTEPCDPLTFTIVPVVLAPVALAACYRPASRAARMESSVALRTE